MIKEAIGVGETLEEATEKAKAELNVSFEDEVQFEVLANPKKKTLGLFGGSLAKVRVFVELPDPAPKKREKKESQRKKDGHKAPAKKAEPKAEKAAPVAPPAEAIPADKIDANTAAGRAVAYLKGILKELNLENTEISVIPGDNGARIILTGENLGIIIGRRGETLDALQYLVSLAANTGDGFFRVSLDTGNYREKREQTLKGLAHRMSKQVLRTGRSRTLEPMNPYERRIIHTEIQAIDGVESHSVGEGAGRRVVISQIGGGRRDDRRGGRRGDNRQAAAPVVDRAPKADAADLPLYGKID